MTIALRRTGWFCATALLMVAAAAADPAPAGARMVVVNGWYGPPYAYAPAPYVYAPPGYVYVPAPPPVQYVVPAPQGQPPAQYWYYCDNPEGYYPYVTSCTTGWRQVQPTPSR